MKAKEYREFWENSIQIKGPISNGPRGQYYDYALLNKDTKEIVAVGEEQGNYAGGLYMAEYIEGWNPIAAMDIIKGRSIKLYNDVILEQNKK